MKMKLLPITSVLLLLPLLQSPVCAAGKKAYIVYLGAHDHSPMASTTDFERAADFHYDLLGPYVGGLEDAKAAIIHSYTMYINAFAAKLEDGDAAEIAKHPDVISVFPSRKRKLHTTHSWDFLGLEKKGYVPRESLLRKARFGEDVIIANIDSGVWPESESFNDEGMAPVPSRWKGSCQNNTKGGVPCNRKLIGSKFFNNGPLSEGVELDSSYYTPRDQEGHGTHTLSTAAGRMVPGVSVAGRANGTTHGGSPGARVASYKVCWDPVTATDDQCHDIDTLAALDAAIHDGVDIISISLGGDPGPFFEDAIAIGTFHAVRHGITVVCSAGNDGPNSGSVVNTAPWVLTVAASTQDRDYFSTAVLGNGETFQGKSVAKNSLPANKLYPLIRSEDAGLADARKNDSKLCARGSLDPKKVEGKIVVCTRGQVNRIVKSEVVRMAGGVGMILVNPTDDSTKDSASIVADPYTFPAVHLTHADGLAISNYISNTTRPVAKITPPASYYGVKPHPQMATFSSRGPDLINSRILKPDITAPGVDIVAAISQQNGSSSPAYQTLDGTSMSCPHVAGVVGLLRTLHPDWTPAMLRSAIMTSATVLDNAGEPIRDQETMTPSTPFAYGAGHIAPDAAADPGLVYDIRTEDYLDFLCGLRHNASENEMRLFSDNGHPCPEKPVGAEDLNYPSIALPRVLKGRHAVARTLKNVGRPGTYKVVVEEPEGFVVAVSPRELSFGAYGEEKKFTVTVWTKKGKIGSSKGYRFGTLVWSDGEHHVRSPLVIKAV